MHWLPSASLTIDYFVEILAELCQTLRFVSQATNKNILSVKSKFEMLESRTLNFFMNLLVWGGRRRRGRNGTAG